MDIQTARKKIIHLLDPDSFKEYWPNICASNYLNFAGYDEKIKTAQEISEETEAVITGTGSLSNIKCMFVVLEPKFMMGSMGLAMGEKITRAFQFASRKKLPVISFSASGGARMQEGTISLMQMVKTAGAVYQHNDRKLLYISVISDPTLGGVTASFASLADIIIGEKGARFGFTGRRIIEETTHEILPDDFQTVEYAKCRGMVDIVVDRSELRSILSKILLLHRRRGDKHKKY